MISGSYVTPGGLEGQLSTLQKVNRFRLDRRGLSPPKIAGKEVEQHTHTQRERERERERERLNEMVEYFTRKAFIMLKYVQTKFSSFFLKID